MRNPALRALFVAVVVLGVIAGAGVAAADAHASSPVGDASSPVGDASSPVGDAPSLDTDEAPTEAGEPSLDTDVPSVDDDDRSTARPQVDDDVASPSTTRIRIDLRSDRDARWTVSVRYSLADENETAAFEGAGERFVDGEAGPDPALFEGFRREANRNVDRSMEIQNVDREVFVHDDPEEFDVATDEAVAVGELRLTFTWTSFLEQDDETLVLGDALTLPNNGTWLRTLEDDQTIEVGTPDGYSVSGTPGSSVTQLEDGDVIIEGPQTFEDDDRVAVVYGQSGVEDPPWQMLTAAIVLAAVLIAGGLVGYRRISGDDEEPTGAPGDAGGPDPGGNGGFPTAAEGGAEDSAAASGGAAAGASGDTDDEPDLSLLSDEERVERLLGNNGGRMRQADIVSETGWSDAKVSQLLSAMADEGRVEKLRLGRENLISLPDGAETGDGADGADDTAGATGADDVDGTGRDGDGR